MLDAHREEAMAAIRRRVGDVPDAQDCVQDAMMRLVQRGDLDPERVRSLLARTAVHIAIDRGRARRREEYAAARLRVDAERQVVWPDQLVTDRADERRVLNAVDTLPPREREVMRLRLVVGLTVAETARLLGVTYKSIEGTYTRARARIRAMLGGALAWLVARMRRLGAPQSGEPLAAAAAVVVAVLLASPFWRHAVNAPRGSGGGVAAAELAAGRPAAPSGGGSVPPGLRPGFLVDCGGDHGRGGGQGDGHDRHPQTIFTTGPISVPNPVGQGNQPPLISAGPLTISGGPVQNLDPVGGVERCLAQGGPTETIGPDGSIIGGCDT